MKKNLCRLTIIVLTSLGLSGLCACSQLPATPVKSVSQDTPAISVESISPDSTEESDSVSDASAVQSISEESVKEPLMAYTEFLSNLTVHDSDAIIQAYDEYERLTQINNETKINDELFRKFQAFFHLVQTSLADTILPVEDMTIVLDAITEQSKDGSYYKVKEEDSFSEDAEIQMSALLRNNGYAAYFSECGYYLSEDPTFLNEKCSDHLSEGMKEYLGLRSTYLKTGAVIDDAGLRMPWDQLADRIDAWESYARKYPGTPEAETAIVEAQNYFNIYLTCRYLDNTPMFKEEVLTDEVRESYERFIHTYPSSKYYEIVSNYYSILKENQFLLTSEAVDYLLKNDLDISLPDYSEEPYIISSTCFYPIEPSRIQEITIVMTEGDYSEQPEAGPYGGWNYEGSFAIEGRDSAGNLVSTLDLNQAFGGENLIFGSTFALAFEDYNQDGYLDFTVGQWGSSNGYIYRLFTINKDSQIVALPTEDDFSIFSACFDYSTFFEKAGDTVFLAPFYDNTVGKNQIAYYQWDGTKYKVAKTQVSEE